MGYSKLSLSDVHSGKLDIAKEYKGYLYSEKMDGWFAYWSGQQMFTKSGKGVFPLPIEQRRLMPDTPMAGELVLVGHQSTDVRQLQKPDGPWHKAKFYAFDLPRCRKPFSERTQKLKQIVESQCSRTKQSRRGCFLQYLPHFEVTTSRDFMRRFNNIVNCKAEYKRTGRCFGEGVVITHPDSLYENGRADRKTRVKLKKVQDNEATVVGYSTSPVSLRVRFKGKTFRLAAGLSHAQRANLKKHFPKGSLVKFSYRLLSDAGVPKEARVIGIRPRDDMS